jgi:hypothetical protein
MNCIWIVEVRDRADEPWLPSVYAGLSRAWARQEQRDARIQFKFTRIVKYIREA